MAPACRAISAVPSEEPSSTTTTLPTPDAERAALTTSPTVDASLRAGTTTSKKDALRLHRHVFRVLDVLAVFRVADVLRAGLLGDLLQEELGAALGAVLVHRLLPQRALAVRVAAAGPERLAPPRALLHHLALAALEAGHARGLRRLRLRPGL